MSSIEINDLDAEAIQLPEVKYPPAIPAPRLPGIVKVVYEEADDPSVLIAIREGLRTQVDIISEEEGVELPKDDVVEVGSELAGNALGRLAVPPRHLTGVRLAYEPFEENASAHEDQSAVGRLALLVSDSDREFRYDKGRADFHRGLLVVSALSDWFAHYKTNEGKTVIAGFRAFRAHSNGTYHN